MFSGRRRESIRYHGRDSAQEAVNSIRMFCTASMALRLSAIDGPIPRMIASSGHGNGLRQPGRRPKLIREGKQRDRNAIYASQYGNIPALSFS